MRFVVALLAILFSADLPVQSFWHGVAPPPAPTCPDTVPAIAAAVGFSTCTFHDNMQSASTVDTNQTNLANFNWYPEQTYCYVTFVGSATSTVLTVTSVPFQNGCGPGTGPATLGAGITIGAGLASQVAGDIVSPGTTITQIGGTCGGGSCTGTGTTGTYLLTGNSKTVSSTTMNASYQQPASSFVFSAAGMEMTNAGVGGQGQGANNFSISTTVLLDRSGSTVTGHGTSFINGMMWRDQVTWNEGLSNSGCVTSGMPSLNNCRWPAEWGTNFTPGFLNSGAIGVEFDSIDCTPTTGSAGTCDFLQHLHAYGVPVQGQVDTQLTNSPRSQLCNPALDGTTFHKLDTLWVPTTNGFFGNMGLFVWFLDVDTCTSPSAFSVGNASFSGTTMTINTLTAGALVANQWISCNGCGGGLQIASGSGSTWTVNGSVGTLTNVNFIGSNMEGCPYYLSAMSPCPLANPSQNVNGLYSYAETYGTGVQLILTAACAAIFVSTPAQTSECNGLTTNAYPVFHKDQQVWQSSISNRVVQ